VLTPSSATNLKVIISAFRKELTLFSQQGDKSAYLGNRIMGYIRFYFFQAKEWNSESSFPRRLPSVIEGRVRQSVEPREVREITLKLPDVPVTLSLGQRAETGRHHQ
jgi:hypothetical protein